jgi:hypothetical protein
MARRPSRLPYAGHERVESLRVDATLDVEGVSTLGALKADAAGFLLPITSADATAPNNSIYYSSDASKLVYKDGAGAVNDLY